MLDSLWQGVSSHGKPGKVVEFHFLFPGLEKSWKLTPGFEKFIKVMEIIRHPLVKPHDLVPLLNPAHPDSDIDMSSRKIEIDLIFVIILRLNRLQIIQGMACLILPPCIGTCLFHAHSQVKGHWIFSFGHGKIIAIQWIHSAVSEIGPLFLFRILWSSG